MKQSLFVSHCGVTLLRSFVLMIASFGFLHAQSESPAKGDQGAAASNAVLLRAPAGDLPATRATTIDGFSAAVLPNGRFVTPVGTEVNLSAPKPFGMDLSPNGNAIATINSGASRFSVTLVTALKSASPTVQRVNVNATFLGVLFSADGSRFYASGGENGNIWIGDVASAQIIGSVNLNGALHPLMAPLNPAQNPPGRFKGTYPGRMVLSPDGRYLYVVDQGSFSVFVIDTTKILPGLDASARIIEPNNFAAVVGQSRVGRYPFGIGISADAKTLFVSNVGMFQYTHLRPANPTGDNNKDYPLGYPGVGYPEETEADRNIRIKKVDPDNLPDSLRDPEGIRVGYIAEDLEYTIPGLGSPNAPEASSIYVLSLDNPAQPQLKKIVKTGPGVGQVESGLTTYAGSHPNAVAVGQNAIYVSNGNNDTISVLNPQTYEEQKRISLSVFNGTDRRLKGIQPVGLTLSPEGEFLYVAEAGINAVGVVRLEGSSGKVVGHIPVGWWPSSVRVSADGKTLYIANAKGRGAGPNNSFPPDNLGSPKASTLGTLNIVPIPTQDQLASYTQCVLANNGFVETTVADDGNNPIPGKAGVASKEIKHVIFINKENSTFDQLLGDITLSRGGAPVNGEPTYSLGYDASPNHHELALRFTLGDNFFLEPAVSSDGHRWLTNMYTTEFEETHWPASYGGQRRDSGDDPNVFVPYPGRIGFTDADGSPAPEDYNQHGGIYLHLARNGRTFVNFGNGYEFALVDEDGGTAPTGIREHANVPMEKVIRDNSDHLFPEFNTAIPDAPLPENPKRFNRFGRFKQVFESHYVNRKSGKCLLPDYVDLYYPNDHGGGAFDINPNGPAWSYKRFVQDNDAALGKTVELLSHSPCWKDTVIFVVEDDPQNGLDHVDGYRSIFLAISPWVKHEHITKTHLSLASIFKTVDLIFGIPPLNQYDAAATDLRELFTSRPDFTPYDFTQVQFAKGANKAWLAMTRDVDFSRPDADEVKLRHAILKSEGLPRKK